MTTAKIFPLILTLAHSVLVPINQDITGLSGAIYQLNYDNKGLTKDQASKACKLALRSDRHLVDFIFGAHFSLPSDQLELPTSWTGFDGPPISIGGTLESVNTLEFNTENDTTVHHYMVCEKAPGKMLAYADCPPAWKPGLLTNLCYQHHEKTQTFSKAQDKCVKNGGTLFEPKVPADLYDIMAADLPAARQPYYWIGLRVAKDELVWLSDRTPLSQEHTLLHPLKSKVDPHKAYHKCMLLTTAPVQGHANVGLEQFACDSYLRYACQRPSRRAIDEL